jgi:hypothetical protein
MSRDDQKLDPRVEFLVRLFGDIDELEGEELDLLFETVAPEEDATAKLHRFAENAAGQFRLKKQTPPEHVQSALTATGKQRSVEKSSISTLREIVDQLVKPTLGPVHDPAFAYRNLEEGEITDEDRKILDQLEDELKQDWSDKEE